MVSANCDVGHSVGFDSQRLHELEEVTRGYAQYGRIKFGLGLSANSIWLVAAGLAHVRSSGWGRLLLVVGAPLWYVMVVMARRWYQRRGAVEPVEKVPGKAVPERPPRVHGLRNLLLVGGAATGALLLGGPSWFDASPLPKALSLGLVVTCCLVTVLLARRVGRGYFDTSGAATPLFMAWMSGMGGVEPDFSMGLGLAAVGLLGVGVGIYEHLQFRRLERRLLALQEHKVDDASSLMPERR